MNIFTNTPTDRRLGELASDTRRRKYFSTFVFAAPNELAWLTITFEHTTGSWVAELTKGMEATERAAEGNREAWGVAQHMAERFIGEETDNASEQ